MARKKKGFEGLGTINDLVKATGVPRRTLYCMRAANVFKVKKKVGYRSVYYDMLASVARIKRFVHARSKK